MKDSLFEIVSNRQIAKNTYEMVISGDISHITAPGQFVNLKLDGFYLRRPISVCDAVGARLTLIYKVVGEGTEKMAGMQRGEKILTLTGLGNGYDTSVSGDRPLLIGGGAGVPPMYMLCKKLIAEGKHPTVILGFGSRDEVFYEEEFRVLGADVLVTTAHTASRAMSPTPSQASTTATSTPAVPSLCWGRSTISPRPRASSPSRREWAAASALVWAAPARRNTATSASAATAPCL